ncbi:hybrid nucleoside-diphosphate sugar epimerase/sugar transferase [Novosphingobium panipatense]|uniref:Sugar transferase involved in LPS biosynthesis (Colanic, teichoic acid) n=2 Tax=Novosphingobium panipatense TaxID=428991 RepID=A0ABY1QWE3_9SPHN|nr:Sugar transferase involved in LPS biosynthesis (colanic, teichoic acid) [Novosphingobium panipatense]
MIAETTNHYDFIITGASGNIGRHLIPILAKNGRKVLAVSRNSASLRMLYAGLEGVDVADYEFLANQQICHTLVHLAVRNNNQSGSLNDFIRDNVDFSTWICAQFNRMGGQRFVNIASIQSLDDANTSYYAISKRIAQQCVKDIIGDKLDNVYIGYFHGKSYFGKRLSPLNSAGIVGKYIFDVFKIIKPSTSLGIIADHLLKLDFTPNKIYILTDDLLKSSAYRYAVRATDIIVSISILLLLIPFLIIIYALIRIDSPGPVVFAQARVGKHQALFTLYKFRTMKRDTIAAGTHEVSVSAVTRVGRFLRKTKLDELPQAINLLRGEMTLVGPRPCLPVQEELINARSVLGVYTMKPGITGYAQIRDIDMSRPQELANSDHIYMKLQSLSLNLKIILLTAFGRGRGDKVALPKDL